MAYDATVAAMLRAGARRARRGQRAQDVRGLCFMLDGNMICGTYRDGGMYRVGKANAAAALALPHVRPMTMTGRPMPGLVEAERRGDHRSGAAGAAARSGARLRRVLPAK